MQTLTSAQAQRKVDAIDKRIDAVRAELLRNETVDELSAASWQAAWDKQRALHAIELSLFLRRGEAQDARDGAAAKEASIALRRANREYIERRAYAAKRASLGMALLAGNDRPWLATA